MKINGSVSGWPKAKKQMNESFKRMWANPKGCIAAERAPVTVEACKD
jgi:hypothetical protein